jgi:monothiol glutaredoxin
VLDNDIVRNEVKKFSDWPTYPQLYIKGNLIGGADILNEMNKDGSLEKLLNESKLV